MTQGFNWKVSLPLITLAWMANGGPVRHHRDHRSPLSLEFFVLDQVALLSLSLPRILDPPPAESVFDAAVRILYLQVTDTTISVGA